MKSATYQVELDHQMDLKYKESLHQIRLQYKLLKYWVQDVKKEINPDNPRMYYLQGTSKFFTPKAFGGGKKAALPYFEKAETLFAKEPGGDITKPYWGKQANTYFLAQCKVEDKE